MDDDTWDREGVVEDHDEQCEAPCQTECQTECEAPCQTECPCAIPNETVEERRETAKPVPDTKEAIPPSSSKLKGIQPSGMATAKR